MSLKKFLLITLLTFPVLLNAAGGDLDLTFDTDGKLTTWFGGSLLLSENDYGRAVALQPADNKIIVVGISQNGAHDDFALARYNWGNGALDTATDGDSVVFGTDGRVRTNFNSCGFWSYSVDRAYAVLIQGDKILVGGSAETFGAGCTRNPADFALARYNMSDGTLDTAFDGDTGVGNGKVTTPVSPNKDEIQTLAFQGEKIIAAGYEVLDAAASANAVALVRYNANGTVDGTFGPGAGGGIVTTILTDPGSGQAQAVAIQPNNYIVVAGYAHIGTRDAFAVLRYTDDGALDDSFGGGDGWITFNFTATSSDRANAVAIDSSGRIIVAGYSQNGTNQDFALARLDPVTGNLDETFDGDSGTSNGLVTTAFTASATDESANAIYVESDGRILVAGRSGANFSLARYLSDGRLDTTFSGDGKLTTDFGSADTARGLLVRNNKILVIGSTGGGFVDSDFSLARYLDDFRPELAVDLSANETAVAVGTTIAVGVGVTNAGPDIAENVQLNLPTPSGVSFVSSDDAACTGGGAAVTCNFGVMTGGSTRGPTINLKLDLEGTYPITATLSTSGLDTNPANNSDRVTLSTTMTPTPFCGNGTCDSGEDTGNCPADCGNPPPFCGDGTCNGSETCYNCPADCQASCPPPQVCGNGMQEGDEACDDGNTADGDSCSADCKQVTTPAGTNPELNNPPAVLYKPFNAAHGGGFQLFKGCTLIPES